MTNTLHKVAKARQLIKFLLDGYPVYKDGAVYRLDQNYDLCIEATSHNPQTDKTESILLKVLGDPTLAFYVKWAEEMSDEDYFETTSIVVLNESKHRTY